MKGVELVCVGALGESGENFLFIGGAESTSIESDELHLEEGLNTTTVFFHNKKLPRQKTT